MGMRRERRRWDTPAADKIAMARAMIEEADRRWHGMAAFLERSGTNQNAELNRVQFENHGSVCLRLENVSAIPCP
jgi:hypothetical protein